MANNLSLTGADEQCAVFECPNCKQTIDVSASQCRYCSVAIDSSAAQAAAEFMSKVNQACSDASFLRTVAISIFAFFGIMFIPFFGLLGICGYYFVLFAVPFLVIRWWVKFHRIRTDDRDFRRARTTVIVVSVLYILPWTWTISSHI